MDTGRKKSQRVLFLKRFVKCPSMIGSIMPSSSFLTRKMVRSEELEACRNIVEMGAGTGVFTEQLLKKKPDNCSLHVFEKDVRLKSLLLGKYPGLSLFDEAAHLKHLFENGKIGQPDLIVSGLPFAILAPPLKKEILAGVYDVLPEGGKFITFQYSLNLLKELREKYAKVELDFELKNIPPAFIYRCTKGEKSC